jgi:pimeloyl-ACP methyl ester carboxylesterase
MDIHHLVELDGVGHFENLEKAQTFNQILLDYLTRVDVYQK